MISTGEEHTLEELRDKLGLTAEEAQQIRDGEALSLKEQKENREKYRKTLVELIAKGDYPLSDFDQEDLRTRKRDLGLTDDDIAG